MSQGSTAAGQRQSWLILLYVILGVAGILPFLLFEYPRVVDYPNHWARLIIECAPADSPLRQMYRGELGLVPNMGIDLLNAGLCGVIGPKTVLLVTFVVAQAMVLWAVAWIQRSLWGRLTPLALLVPALSLNLVSVIGYWNYLVGAALALALIAIVLARHLRPTLALLIVCNVVGVMIFLSHAFAALFAAVLLFAYALSNWFGAAAWPRRGVSASLFTIGCFAAPAACALVSQRVHGALAVDYMLKGRIVMAPFSGLYPPVDIATTVLVGFAFIRLMATRMLRVGTPLLLPVIALLALCVVIPSNFGSTYPAVDIDSRLAISALTVFLAAAVIDAGTPRAAGLFIMLAVAVTLTRWGAVIAEWPRYDSDVRETRHILSTIDRGATLISVIADNPSACAAAPWTDEPYFHLGSFATIDREGFHALTFAGKGMQPVQAQGRYAALASPPYGPIPVSLMPILAAGRVPLIRSRNLEYAVRWPETFDYVLFHHFGCAPNFDANRLNLVATGRVSSLLKIRKSGE